MKPTFNAAVLAQVVEELQILPGGQIQRIAQPGEHKVILSIFKSGVGEKHLLIDVSPRFFRAHFTTRRFANPPSPSPFCMTLRKYLQGGKILKITQRDGDRILDIKIQSGDENFLLSAELMGKHANLILVSPDGKVLHAAKLITSKQSRVREVLPGREYSAPPTSGAPRQYDCAFENSAAIDAHFARTEENAVFDAARSTLLGMLRKTSQQKTRALAQVRRGATESTRADEFQKFGDLIFSQLHAIPANAEGAELTDYFAPDAPQIRIPLDADLSPQENAQKYFQKSRHARESADELHQLQAQLETEVAAIEKVLAQAEAATTIDELRKIQESAQSKKWLRAAGSGGGSTPGEKQKSSFEGHKIKRLVSPDDYEILIGESATANDYLVTRLAHSNDWWLHLRGGTSSHAIIRTGNAPDRVPLNTLLFAARQVVARSVAKHAGWAEVDYTLKKYVRKPRKAAPGSVLISNQKTLRVEPQK